MPAILALLPQLISLLPTMRAGASEFVAWVQSIRKTAQQSGEWTPELEAAFLEALAARLIDPAYQPDAPTA